jgi:putative FmdB family regulatory protein
MEYEHLCNACNTEFELEYSMHAPVPTLCPLCGVDGQVKRLISCKNKGRVELTGREYQESIKQGAGDLVKEARRDERLLANLVGSKYRG